MSRFFLALLSFVLIFMLGGCEYDVSEEKISSELQEDAMVADLVYTPSNHGSGLSPTVDLTGNGGLGVAFTSVSIPEKYAVIFQCQHGKFIVQDDQEKAKELWNRLKTGQKVVVKYTEVYEEDCLVTTEWFKEKTRKLTARKLLKYHFIDAN